MLRLLLLLILIVVVGRSFWRLVDGIVEGASATPPRGSSGSNMQRSVHMVKDPVCGTYVVPERAIVLNDGRQPIYFCSTACRDQYRARTA